MPFPGLIPMAGAAANNFGPLRDVSYQGTIVAAGSSVSGSMDIGSASSSRWCFILGTAWAGFDYSNAFSTATTAPVVNGVTLTKLDASGYSNGTTGSGGHASAGIWYGKVTAGSGNQTVTMYCNNSSNLACRLFIAYGPKNLTIQDTQESGWGGSPQSGTSHSVSHVPDGVVFSTGVTSAATTFTPVGYSASVNDSNYGVAGFLETTTTSSTNFGFNSGNDNAGTSNSLSVVGS